MKYYCKHYKTYLSWADMQAHGCINTKKQKRFGRKICKYLVQETDPVYVMENNFISWGGEKHGRQDKNL